VLANVVNALRRLGGRIAARFFYSCGLREGRRVGDGVTRIRRGPLRAALAESGPARRQVHVPGPPRRIRVGLKRVTSFGVSLGPRQGSRYYASCLLLRRPSFTAPFPFVLVG
jgi:hypothetical protein